MRIQANLRSLVKSWKWLSNTSFEVHGDRPDKELLPELSWLKAVMGKYTDFFIVTQRFLC
jgi:hypothetical protein